MKTSELSELYVSACAVCVRTPNDDQFAAWRKSLGAFEKADVRAALDAWQQDMSEVIVFGETAMRGASMPTHLDLLKLVMREKNKRRADGKFVPCGIDGCTEGFRLQYRETNIYGTPQMERFQALCQCLKDWKAGRPSAPAAVKTLDADLILLKSLRTVH